MKISAFIKRLPAVLKKPFTSEKWQRFGFALFSTLFILLLVKIPIKRYYLELQEGQVLHHSSFASYLADDLDSDGNTERIYISNFVGSNLLTISLFDINGILKESIPLTNHVWSQNSHAAIYDIDEDGKKEVLMVTIRNDSVFLNAINLLSKKFVVFQQFVGIVERPGSQLVFSTNFLGFEDYNRDGNKELYFQFDIGYGLNPRGYFRYDPKSQKIFSSPKSYIAWLPPVFHDLNRDGVPEVLAWSYAPSNVPFETEFNDGRAWIGAFDLEMNYLFPPIPMPEGYGGISTSPTTFADSLFFAYYSNLSSDTIPNRIFLIDYHGNILNEKAVFQDDPTLYSQKMEIIDNKNYLLINNIGQFELTAELDNLPQQKIQRQKNYNPFFHLISWPVDVNGNGKKEQVYYNLNTSVIEILNDRYKELASFRLPIDRLRITNIYPYLVNGKTDRLMVVTDSGYFFMQYTENLYYWAKYLVWLGIFLTAWGFTWLVQFFQRRRMEQKWETEKQLTELQFNTIRNQLNPHFVFNALSSVGYLIETGKKEEAYDFLSVNTRLIRKVLDDAELTTRTLSAEINFVKDYLSVQEFRFKNRFQTIFITDENVNLQLAVPKMVLHTYVENAVKHGFKNINTGGFLEIRIDALPKGVIFTVRDNGNLEEVQTDSAENIGKGIKIMESYYRLFEKQHKCRIQTTFTKLRETDPEKTGTEVVVRIEFLSCRGLKTLTGHRRFRLVSVQST
jgi:hypothetical protein